MDFFPGPSAVHTTGSVRIYCLGWPPHISSCNSFFAPDLSMTIAANFQSMMISSSSSLIFILLVMNLSSLRMHCSSRLADALHECACVDPGYGDVGGGTGA